MEFGDFATTAHDDYTPEGKPPATIGIEYATVTDLLGKITSGRLSKQIVGMLDAYDIQVLVIQGMLRPDAKGYVDIKGAPRTHKFKSVKGILRSARAHGVRVEETFNLNETLDVLKGWLGYYHTPPTGHTFFREVEVESTDFIVPIGAKIERAISVVMAMVDGIGEDKARAALKMYPVLAVLFTLDVDALKRIPGWGTVLAKNFYNASLAAHIQQKPMGRNKQRG